MKKSIAFLLVLCMLCSCLPVFAASDGAKQEMTEEAFDGEIIVSHTQAEKTGEWKESGLLNYDGKPTAFAGPESEITFTPKGLKKGNYEIYYWVILHPNNKTQHFTVNHNGKQSETYAHFKIDAGEEEKAGWVSLGVFDFAGKGKENLYLKALEGNTRATAVKFVPTTKEALGKEIPVEEEAPEQAEPGAARLSHSIDSNLSGHCYYVGAWDYSGALTGPMTVAPYSLWIAGAGPEAYVEYRPEILADCNVRVSVYLLYWPQSQVNDIKYEVYHNGKVDEFHLDPTSITESQWVTLGTFDFGGNDEDYVRLECVKSEEANFNTRASTVAFEIMNDDAKNADDPGAVWQTRYVSPDKDSESVYVSQTYLMAPMNKFADMKDHWAHYDVEYMAFEGLVSGVSDDTFDPEAKISRAEYVTILDRAMGYEIINGDSFTDVSADSWYAPYVATAKANGLLNGLPTDDGFKPEQPITREEMALFTYNAIKATKCNDEWVKSMPDGWANFSDTQSVSDWAKEALKYLIQTGIIKGTSDTTVSPMENATRAQGAVILKRFMQSFVWAGPPTDEEWVMTFNDEFFGDGLNYDVWQSDNYPYGNGISSTRGPDNVEVKDGVLHMITKKEQKADKEWTTAHIWVKPEVFRQAYGYFESRYKICAANGINNAFWLMTSGAMVSDYSQNFEIDINEGHYPNEVCPTYHYYNTGEHNSYSKPYRATYDLSEDYHTYGLEWNPDELIYYFDNKEIARYKNENATIPLFPYLSSAVLSWAGSIAGEEAHGSAQIVDYVRVWQRPEDVNDPNKTAFNRPVVPAEFAGIKGVFIDKQIVDNTTYPGEIILAPVTTGEWKDSIAVPGHTGQGHLFCQRKDSRADFMLDGIKAGKYKIYFWRLPHESNKPQENIFLAKPDGTEELVGSVALIPNPGTTAEPGWVEIGEADLTSKDILRLNYVSGISRVSGIKLVPIK
ncbi:MAG: S-layer homology domain-containing protein [Clostridia bacterium]|nr:S-layer homology domain-containing protein [Clostridia bacterium]